MRRWFRKLICYLVDHAWGFEFMDGDSHAIYCNRCGKYKQWKDDWC